MKYGIRLYSFAFLILFLVALPAMAQNASLVGTVKDQQDASMPNVTVTLTNVESNITQTTKTDAGGSYEFSFVRPGRYTLKAEQTGFKTFVQSAFALAVSERARVDAVMQIGEASATVTVEATPTGVQTESSTLGSVVENKKIVEIPLNGRFFLDLALDSELPVPSLLTQFRARLGAERFGQVFHEILRQARAAGLVKDRLRLKDATHLIANIALPSALRLVAQTREQLLSAAESFAAAEVAAHRAAAAVIRQATTDLKEEQRLLQRVGHLRELVAWGEAWRERLEMGAPPVTEAVYDALTEALTLAHKVLADRAPQAPDKLLSLADRDARTGKHGDYFDGYLLDLSLDADSELITAVEVLPGNGDEAANALTLIEQEEAAHGNQVERLSIDSIGYRGTVLQALSDDPAGPQVEVFVPPIERTNPPPELFSPDAFQLDHPGLELTCPGGQKTRTRMRESRDHGWQYRFRASQCRVCPLHAQCLKPTTPGGRRVSKNDYEPQYRAAQARAQTEEYRDVRRRHPRIERKLAELIRWHQGRRVRYRGRLRVKIQYWLTALVVNCKRIVKLLAARLSPHPT